MEFLTVIIASVISVFAMLIIEKIVGYRQITQLSIYDYINSITLGSIAAELAISHDITEASYCFIAMIIYGAFTFIFSVVTSKSRKVRSVLEGHPIILMEKGKLYRNSFKKAHMDLNEFLEKCRFQGYFDPSKIDTVIMETSGDISVIPVASERPVTPNDLNISASTATTSSNVIMDGFIQHENLSKIGKSEKWLKEKMMTEGIKSEKDVFLATVNNDNVTFFKLETGKVKNNII